MIMIDNNKLAVTSYISINIYNLQSYEQVSKLSLNGHMNQIRCINFVPHKNWIISSGDDKTVKIWDASSL